MNSIINLRDNDKDKKAVIDSFSSSTSTSFSIPEEIIEATSGLSNESRTILLKIRKQDNALTIANYILTMKNEINPSDNYRMSTIKVLAKLSNFFFILNDENKHKHKLFLEIIRQDLIQFLDSFRKSEPLDPLHKWIGTYNNYLKIITRFFKWLYYPNLAQKDRQKPEVITNLPSLKRKETSIYQPGDLWTQDDDQLFLKYCPSLREKCYHMISRDTACRPSEILGLRMKDIQFKMANDRQYAEVMVNGKTGSRCVPLINSIPYLKDWIDVHPQRSNPNAYLIFGKSKSFGKKMKALFINRVYANYKREFFPKLLEDPKVLPEDKVKIRELLKKPWNPYIRRHSALTEKSQLLKENVLRQYAGWSMGSNMHLKYLHYFGNESNQNILEAYGLKPKAQEIDKMKPRQCPNCSELNKIDSKFCVKCRMVLSYDAYSEVVEKQNESHVDFEQKAMTTITVMADRMKRFEELLIESGIVDIQQARKLKADSSSYALKTLKDKAKDKTNKNKNTKQQKA